MPEDVIPINGTEEDVEELRKQMNQRRLLAKEMRVSQLISTIDYLELRALFYCTLYYVAARDLLLNSVLVSLLEIEERQKISCSRYGY